MATRGDAKRAIWSASKKDDKARKALTEFLSRFSESTDRDCIPNDELAEVVKAVRK